MQDEPRDLTLEKLEAAGCGTFSGGWQAHVLSERRAVCYSATPGSVALHQSSTQARRFGLGEGSTFGGVDSPT